MSYPKNNGIHLKRTLDGFVFASRYDQDLAKRWALGTLVRADIHAPRSGKHQRWYRALLRIVWTHQDHFVTPEAIHRALQWRLGEYDAIRLRSGEIIIDFHSTGFQKMEEGAFKEHVDRCWDIIAAEIIPGVGKKDKKQLFEEIDALLLGSERPIKKKKGKGDERV